MRLPAHLRRHPSGLFHFRFAVPAPLRATVGLSEVTCSLGTRDPILAQGLAYTLAHRVAHFLSQLRSMSSKYNPTRLNPNDPSTFPSSKSGDTFRDMVVRLPGGIQIEADPSNPMDIRAAQDTLRQMMGHESVKKALKAAAAAPQIAGGGADAQGDPTLVAKRLAHAIDEYLLTLLGSSTHTEQRATLSLRHFQEWLKTSTFEDKNPWMHEISTEHIQKWKLRLAKEMEERAIKKRASAQEQRKISADPELAKVPPKIVATTGDNYIQPFGKFLAEMQTQGHYPKQKTLPTRGQSFVSKKKRQSATGWHHFTTPELQRIFAADNYRQLVKPHEYWFPLICLLTGARREEIAQLTLDDIREEDGIWIIDINSRGASSVKTPASVRLIPLHPVLVELGLLRYRDAVRAAKGPRLFPYLRYDQNNGFGDVPGEAFARYLQKIGIKDEGKVLHSLRKNANDRLQKAGVDEALRCAMLGHEYVSVNVTNYTKGISLQMLATMVLPKLTFSELDFAVLNRPQGFADVLTQEIEAANLRRQQAAARTKRKAELDARKAELKKRDARRKNDQ